LSDGTQYLGFVPPNGHLFNLDNEDWRKVKSWTAVLHLFDAKGNHLKSEARHRDYDIEGRDAACGKAWAEVHAMFTPYYANEPKGCDIFVKSFSVVLDGITHSLLYRATQAEEGDRVFEGVFLEPLGVMFHPPWDNG
jgi:hypothetical protein